MNLISDTWPDAMSRGRDRLICTASRSIRAGATLMISTAQHPRLASKSAMPRLRPWVPCWRIAPQPDTGTADVLSLVGDGYWSSAVCLVGGYRAVYNPGDRSHLVPHSTSCVHPPFPSANGTLDSRPCSSHTVARSFISLSDMGKNGTSSCR